MPTLALLIALSSISLPALGQDPYEPDNSSAQAVAMPNEVAQTFSRSILNASDVDWFTFTLPLSGRIACSMDANVNGGGAVMTLYDSVLTQITSSPSSFTTDLAAGVYYVRITSSPAVETAYAMYVQIFVQDTYEPDDSAAAATPITSGVPQQHSLYPATGQIDWLSFTAAADSIATITVTGLFTGFNRPSITLYNQSESVLTFAEGTSNGTTGIAYLRWRVSAGNYYIRVHALGSNPIGYVDYALTLTPLAADSYEADNSSGTATLLTAGSLQANHTIYPQGDQDWVRFTLAQQSNILLETKNAAPNPQIELFNNALSPIGSANTRIATNLTAGNYFARITYATPPEQVVSRYDVLLSSTAGTAVAKNFVFDRSWPTLQQPWYFNDIRRVRTSRQDNAWIADNGNGLVHKYSADGNLISTLSTGYGANDVAVAEDGTYYVMLHNGCSCVRKYSPENELLAQAYANGFAIALDPATNRLFVNYSTQMAVYDATTLASLGFWGVTGIPLDIAVSPDGFIYVTKFADQVSKYTPDGELVFDWTSSGTQDGQLSYPGSISFDRSGLIYIADHNQNTSRIQVFTDNGSGLQFVRKISTSIGDTPFAAAIDGRGSRLFTMPGSGDRIIVSDAVTGQKLNTWTSSDVAAGHYIKPGGISIDGTGNVHVTDNFTIRISSPAGQSLSTINNVNFHSDYPFIVRPSFDPTMYLMGNGVDVLKYSSTGTSLGKFGTYIRGHQIGNVMFSDDAATDGQGYVYIADSGNSRISVFDFTGNFVQHIGSGGVGDGQILPFNTKLAVIVDSNYFVYVADNKKVRKYMMPTGAFVTSWDLPIATDQATDLALDSSNNVYVTTRSIVGVTGDTVFVFSSDGQLLDQLTDTGTGPGAVSDPFGVAIASDGSMFISDRGNDRVQVFKDQPVSSNARAVIVAAGGAYAGNNLWDTTQLSANFAFRTLQLKGFSKDSIQYLSSNLNADLDGNGVADEVDAAATNANLQSTLTTWASANGTQQVVVYLVDHGGPGTFRMSGTETLSASTLDSWLDTLETALVANSPSAKLTIVYDACESGTFSTALSPSSNRRTVITSTSPGQSAYFLSQGTISFSSFFWTQVFNGATVKAAFDSAAAGMNQAIGNQVPLLNDPASLALTTYIGNTNTISGQAPAIGSVVGAQTINNTSSATLWADPVTDADGIARVWATVRPPDFVQSSSTNPITDLPTLDLLLTTGNRYQAIYNSFNLPGTYYIAIYARDRIGNVSAPQLTSVIVGNPRRRKAIVVAGGAQTDPLWGVTQNNAGRAYQSLKLQGYTEQDISFRSPVTFSAGVDGLPSLANLEYLIKTWAKDGGDLVVYLVGTGGAGTFRLGPTETLNAADLDVWLDTLQTDPQATQLGTVTLVYDGDESGSFISQMVAPAGKQRAVLCSTSAGSPARFLSNGDISFSSYFWTRVLNGARVRTAFKHAEIAMRFAGHGQRAILDDNGNGIGGEKLDSLLADTYTIGAGIQLAGDDPVIGSITLPSALSGGGTTATIQVDNVTTTGQISQVLATVSAPDGSSSAPVVVSLSETPPGSKSYQASYNGFTGYGFHKVSVVAIDTEGNSSIPVSAEIHQQSGASGDAYEVDDTLAQARWIDDGQVQTHNFHDAGDLDWIRFTADANEQVTIETFGLGSGSDTEIELYRSNGTAIAGTLDDDSHPDFLRGEFFVFSPSNHALPTGEYYLRVRFAPGSSLSPSFGPQTYYKVRILREIGTGETANFSAVVRDPAGVGITNATLTLQLPSSGCPAGLSPCPYPAVKLEAVTNPSQYTFLTVPVNTTYNMTVSASGYVTRVITVNVPAGAEDDPHFSPVGTVVLQPSSPSPSPVIEVTPTSLEFGNVGSGGSQTLNLTVKNIGSGTLNGIATVSGPFSIVGNAIYVLGAGQSQVVNVQFAPPVTSSDSSSTYVSLSGGGGRQVPVSGSTGVIWMDFAWGGQAVGTFSNPYTSFAQSLPAAENNGIIRIKSSTKTGPVTISSAVHLEAYGGPVRIGVGGGGGGLAPFMRDSGISPSGDFSALLRGILLNAAASTNSSPPAPVDNTKTETGTDGTGAETNVLRDGYVFESVIPYTRLDDGKLQAFGKGPLALRLHATSDILTSSLWQDIEALKATLAQVTWRFAVEGNTADLWVLFRPMDAWGTGDEIRVSTGGNTVTSGTVTAPAYTFVVRPDVMANSDFVIQGHNPNGDPAQIATVIEGSSLTTGAPGGLDKPYTIGPEQVFDTPQLVWLPLPTGRASQSVQLYYYHPYGENAGWYKAQNVQGWLASGNEDPIVIDGTHYIGLRVHHAATVQFVAIPQE